MSQLTRAESIAAKLQVIFAGITRIAPGNIDRGVTFLEMGADSLSLLQASQAIKSQFQVKVPFRLLLDELGTIDQLVPYLDERIPTNGDGATTPAPVSAPVPDRPIRPVVTSDRTACYASSAIGRGADAGHAIGDRQRRHIDALAARLAAKTIRSKALADRYRSVLADRVNVAHFRLPWKELCYPLVVDRAEGVEVDDLDGNRHLDIAMGFGSLLFGHTPPFVVDALHAAVSRGMRLGLQLDIAGETAALVRELTGVERVTFCNSGTEAVMTALRVARCVTGRTRIALFGGSYHGTFDGVLARAEPQPDGTVRTVPAASGVPAHMIDNVLVLPYGTQQSLDVLERHAGELAAVVIEPMPGRASEIEMRSYLRELRRITEKHGAALIFDEVVVGFRFHPGGAQALYDVRADLVTYGKAIGSGMPIGVIAGRTAYMDAIDGGRWQFGDASAPSVEMTLFAGTFFKHPMVIAAARACLTELLACGPSLQAGLNSRAAAMVERINADCEQQQLPARAIACGSMFRFAFHDGHLFGDLLFAHLLDRGIYVCDTRTSYLSTPHTDADVERIVSAVSSSLAEMREGGLIGAATSPTPVPVPPAPVASSGDGAAAACRTHPMTDAQKGLWALAQLGPDSSRAYNEAVNLRLSGPCDVNALRTAVQQLVDRHDALRTTFSADGRELRVSATAVVGVSNEDFSGIDAALREARVKAWLTQHVTEVFDLQNGPLIRVGLLKLGDNEHLLALVLHHIVIDSWSIEILLRDLGLLYSEACLGVPSDLPPPVAFSTYMSTRAPDESGYANDKTYWLAQYADRVPVVALPSSRPRPRIQSYAGAVESVALPADLSRDIRALSARLACTPFTTLLAMFQLLLRRLTGADDMVIGIHLAGQSALEDPALVGFCIETLPLRGRVDAAATFAQHAASVSRRVMDALQHHRYPMSHLIRALKLVRDPARPPLVTVVFNMDSGVSVGSTDDNSLAVPPWWGLRLELAPSPVVFARFDQLWNIVDSRDRFTVQCAYCSDIFDAESVRDALATFVNLLQTFVRTPELDIASADSELAKIA